MLKLLKDLYLRARYGYAKRPARFKIHGLAAMAPAKFRNEEEHYVRTAVIDISSTGAAIECFNEYKVGDEVVMEFTLPTHKVSVACRIMRRHAQAPTWVYGVWFDDYLTDKTAIKQVLAFAKQEMKRLEAEEKSSRTAG